MSSALKFAATKRPVISLFAVNSTSAKAMPSIRCLIQRAKRRLERLDFFQTVNISTAPGSQPDQVVLVVDVIEKSTGEFSIGGGYTTGGETPGPTVEGSITERNFLGRGQYVRLAAGGGLDNNRSYSLSFTEPYFLGQRISAGFDILQASVRC